MAKKKSDFELLKLMCHIPAPSGNEVAMKQFLLQFIAQNSGSWKNKPKVYSGGDLGDCIVLAFGKPRTAVFAHIDNIGFTVRYGRQLVKIGGPALKTGFKLTGMDEKGMQDAELVIKTDKATGTKSVEYKAKRNFERGTELSYKPLWREHKDFVQCCYLDNRLGVFAALKLAETLKDGVIAFSTYEEHGGGSVQFLQKFIKKKFGISQALICDISWISDGVHAAKGPVISVRDSLIPRRAYVNRIISIAKKNKCAFQLEVEGAGGSDAGALQMAENHWDWCFIGAAEDNVHTPDEKVHKKDIEGMIKLYQVLMKEL